MLLRARLKFKGRLINFGSYKDFDDAVRARKSAEREYYGKYLTAASSKAENI